MFFSCSRTFPCIFHDLLVDFSHFPTTFPKISCIFRAGTGAIGGAQCAGVPQCDPPFRPRAARTRDGGPRRFPRFYSSTCINYVENLNSTIFPTPHMCVCIYNYIYIIYVNVNVNVYVYVYVNIYI